MNITIRQMQKSDKNEVLLMMKEFYSSDAVFTNGSEEIFETDFNNCISDFPFLEGFILEKEGETLGYTMISKSFSTEFGKLTIWIEDLYLKKEHRGFGIMPRFFDFLKKLYPETIFKLEAEKENKHAVHVYKKMGFCEAPYLQMKLN